MTFTIHEKLYWLVGNRFTFRRDQLDDNEGWVAHRYGDGRLYRQGRGYRRRGRFGLYCGGRRRRDLRQATSAPCKHERMG